MLTIQLRAMKIQIMLIIIVLVVTSLLGCRYDKIVTERDGFWYTAREGDDLIYIAIRVCVNPGDIRKANNLDYDSTIRPGMRIWIPKRRGE